MKNHVRVLIQKISIVLIISLAIPQVGVADSDLEKLKQRSKKLEQHIQTLNENLTQEEVALTEVVDTVEYIRSNIEQIQKQLNENETRIIALNQILAERDVRLMSLKNGLANLVRDLEVAGRSSAVAVFFNENSFSDAVRELENKEILTKKISAQYQSIIEQTRSIEEARNQLELTKLSLASARTTLDLQYQALQAEQERRQQVVQTSQSILRIAEAEHQEVRRQLFAAAFDSTGRGITLEEATFYARLAVDRLEKATGEKLPVHLLLALIKQESNFGNYLGKGHYKSSMCSQGQIDAFLQITKSLGLDPELTPVSKPAKNQSCGGAMGYAQFLPTTWLGYAARVGELTGNNPPSPWNPEDAFMAAALKLAANGAVRGNTPQAKRRAQWEAVMTYFSGSRWKDPEIAKNISWYGDNILAMADSYRALING